ncbi:hypothetical protein, partial [Pseudomonas aeruginosa]|uniref:hypothetical protein n=1 Tax=Pseudomonas aeruginosa TaxID=287 RepID=UPI0026E11148
MNAVFARNGAAWLAFGRIAAKRGGGLFARPQTIMKAVAEAECNTVTGLKQVHHAATPLLL